jgi:hypothetical protein
MSVRQEPTVLIPIGLGPPKLSIVSAIRGWAALVLAVTSKTKVSHIDLLRHSGRSSKELADGRRLLVWAFLEVADVEEDMAISWLEQCVALGRRSIMDGLKDEPPAELAEVVALYGRLVREMGEEDVQEAVAAGLLGERKPRARVWPKGFLAKLGLSEQE